MAEEPETQVLSTADGDWTIYKRGDHICIADQHGRCRHQSNGHMNTAVHLAMQLQDSHFASTPNADEALQSVTQHFLQDEAVQP